MKNLYYLFVAILSAIGLVSCTKDQDEIQKWEYKIISEYGIDRGHFVSKGIPMPEEELNKLGKDGWELVDVYTRVETVHPNFGNEKYVTGLQPNTRTEAILFVFKRPLKSDNKKSSETKSSGKEVAPQDIETVEAVADTCAF